MAVPVWPSDLPQVAVQDGYSESLADGRLKTPTDTGPGKMRLRTLAPRPVTLTLPPLSNDERVRFEAFWSDDTGGGVLPFNIPDQSHDGLVLATETGAPITTEDDALIPIDATALVMFGDTAPTLTPWPDSGDLWRVSFPIFVMPD